MPSRSALLISQRLQEFIGRPLKPQEMIRCEELAINFLTPSVLRYIEGMTHNHSPRRFDLIYYPIMNGLLRGAYRRMDVITIKSRFKQVYRKVEQFVGDAMTDADMDGVIFLASDCTTPEIDTAIYIARLKGIHSAAYLKSLILGNRRNYMLENHNKPGNKELMPTQYEIRQLSKRNIAKVERLQEVWAARMGTLREKLHAEVTALNVKKSLISRGHSSSNTGDKT